MSEVILPPEELEPELPEEQLPEVDKPTDLSKVITVKFNPLDTGMASTANTRQSFYTTDTDAWIVFEIENMDAPNGEYSLVLYNKSDGSIFQRTGDIVSGAAHYKIAEEEIKHAGEWLGQVVIALANGKTTTSRFSFNVAGHLLDGKDVRQIVIQDFETLMKQLNGLKDDAEIDFRTLKNDIEESNRIAEQNEIKRQEAEKTREESYEEKVDSAIVEADVVKKVDNKVAELSPTIQKVTAQLAQTKRNFITPYFVEYFGSFNKYGLGEPEGIANYTEGNYVLTVKGNAGDKFLTVTSGNINHSGQSRRYPCVIRNDDLIFDLNQVTGTNGDKVLLLEPLQRTITNGCLGNLHDAVQGQHYTKLGYAAFIQHLYFANPKHTERDSVIAQFLPYDTLGNWDITGVKGYNYKANMKLSDDTFGQIGSSRLDMYATDVTKDARWTVNLDGEKGYLETYVGGISGQALVEFYLDDTLIKSVVVDKHVERLAFDYQNAKKGMLKINGIGPFPQRVAIGMTTWFKNKKFTDERLILPDDKVVCIGDSWFVNQAQESAKELENRMAIDGGNPTVLNFSKGGHTSTYARTWFDEYVIKNKPDKVIIEYFTNDFNSTGSTDVGTFINPDGQPQDMNITDLAEYVDNIQYMIDRAIEFGIQPIVVMPAATNSESQVSRFGNFAVQLWHGKKTINDTPIFKNVTSDETTTRILQSNGESNLVIESKAINSSARKGVIIDSDRNLTGGNIAEIHNNGVKKVGIRHDGTIEQSSIKFNVQTSAFVNNSNNRGGLYLLNSSNTGNEDVLILVVQKPDGTIVSKKVQLID